MRDDLRELEKGHGETALVIVSTGDLDDVREEGFETTVLLDPISMTSASVGAGGTPTAVRVAPDGTLRSTIAGGREAVLELADVRGEERVELEVVMAGASERGAT
jgi:hypothetical protein